MLYLVFIALQRSYSWKKNTIVELICGVLAAFLLRCFIVCIPLGKQKSKTECSFQESLVILYHQWYKRIKNLERIMMVNNLFILVVKTKWSTYVVSLEHHQHQISLLLLTRQPWNTWILYVKRGIAPSSKTYFPMRVQKLSSFWLIFLNSILTLGLQPRKPWKTLCLIQ